MTSEKTKKILNFIGYSLFGYATYRFFQGDKPEKIVKEIVNAPAEIVEDTSKTVKKIVKKTSDVIEDVLDYNTYKKIYKTSKFKLKRMLK